MKRKLSIFITVVFLLSLFGNVFAAESNNVMLNFDLTYNGENTVTVNTNDVITVVYNLENVSADEDFTIQSVANEIYFDKDFFEYLGDDEIVKGDYTATGKENVYSGGEHRIYFNGSHLREQKYSPKQFMGSFKLRVKARSGSSIISSREISAYDNNGKKYNLKSTDLAVFVGSVPPELYTVTYLNNGEVYKTANSTGAIKIDNAPMTPLGYKFVGWKCDDDGLIYNPGDTYNLTKNTTFTAVWEEITIRYTLTFVTNGGTRFDTYRADKNTVVDLTEYKPSKSGYKFKGWYSDADFENKVTSIILDGNKTVYAKWEKLYEGGGSGGGVSMYTLSFATNGGTEISPVSKQENTVVDLSKYITKKDGYSFDGWYTEKELTNKVTQVKITGNIAVYAKWVEGNNGETEEPNYKPDIFTDEHYAYIIGRDGGYVYPNAYLTRAEASEMIYRLIAADLREAISSRENDFGDVSEDDWFNVSVSTLAKMGVIKGRDDGVFAPNDNITRAEFTVIMARLSEAEYNGENIFDDVSGHWAEDDINIAASIGWVNGDNGNFRPDDSITRAEVITLINRVLNRMPESKSDLLEGMVTPPDNTDESAWYYLAIQEAVNSHDYEEKSDKVHEKWTELSENPVW